MFTCPLPGPHGGGQEGRQVGSGTAAPPPGHRLCLCPSLPSREPRGSQASHPALPTPDQPLGAGRAGLSSPGSPSLGKTDVLGCAHCTDGETELRPACERDWLLRPCVSHRLGLSASGRGRQGEGAGAAPGDLNPGQPGQRAACHPHLGRGGCLEWRLPVPLGEGESTVTGEGAGRLALGHSSFPTHRG